MDKINFQNGVTKVNADTFNTFQDNIEKSAVVVSPTQPTTNEKVWFKKGKNYFNKNGNIIKGYSLNADGGINSGADYFYSADYISVQPNTTYTIQQKNADTFRICEYTANKAFIKRDTSATLTYTFTTGSTTYFVRISSLITNLDSLQLELGSTASTYEAYIDPTIFVKNGSIFDEFITALSPKQFELQNREGSTNYNDFKRSGFYQCNFQNGTNAPSAYATGILLVLASYYIVQLLISQVNNEMHVYARMSTNQGSTWIAWKEL